MSFERTVSYKRPFDLYCIECMVPQNVVVIVSTLHANIQKESESTMSFFSTKQTDVIALEHMKCCLFEGESSLRKHLKNI